MYKKCLVSSRKQVGLSGWVCLDIASDYAEPVCLFLEDLDFHSVRRKI